MGWVMVGNCTLTFSMNQTMEKIEKEIIGHHFQKKPKQTNLCFQIALFHHFTQVLRTEIETQEKGIYIAIGQIQVRG